MKRKKTLGTVMQGVVILFALMATLSPSQGKPALDVPYEPTSYTITQEMLRIAGVTSTDVVYDLGCGDGRIVIMAAKERKARGVVSTWIRRASGRAKRTPGLPGSPTLYNSSSRTFLIRISATLPS